MEPPPNEMTGQKKLFVGTSFHFVGTSFHFVGTSFHFVGPCCVRKVTGADTDCMQSSVILSVPIFSCLSVVATVSLEFPVRRSQVHGEMSDPE